jgi:purine-binding chemotaxis protein CheW
MSLDNHATPLSTEKMAEILVERAAALAAEPPARLSGERVQLLVFWLGEGQYAFEVKAVRAIYPLAPLTLVPRTPAFFKGLFNARGQILPVLDLHLLLGLEAPSVEAERPQVIVLSPQTEETLALEVGILVDEVIDVIMIFAAQITPPLLTQPQSRYIRGITAGGIMVLNPVELLTDEQLFVDEELI